MLEERKRIVKPEGLVQNRTQKKTIVCIHVCVCGLGEMKCCCTLETFSEGLNFQVYFYAIIQSAIDFIGFNRS